MPYLTGIKDEDDDPRLTVLSKRLQRRTSSDVSTGHQTGRISIRLTMRSGAFCKSECTVTTIAGSVTSTIWKNDWFTNGAAFTFEFFLSFYWKLHRKPLTYNWTVNK